MITLTAYAMLFNLIAHDNSTQHINPYPSHVIVHYVVSGTQDEIGKVVIPPVNISMVV